MYLVACMREVRSGCKILVGELKRKTTRDILVQMELYY